MTRKRIRHEQISNEDRRNATFRKRTEGLLKKANELTILCGVEAAVVIHKKEQSNAVLWPSASTFGERMQKFLDFRSEDRERRICTHESFMEQMVHGEEEEVLKLKNNVRAKETQQLMVKSLQTISLDGFQLDELSAMNSFADDMLKKLQQKDNEFNDD